MSLLLPTRTVLPKELCSEILKVNRWHQQNENDETVCLSTFWHREKLAVFTSCLVTVKGDREPRWDRSSSSCKGKSQATMPCETDRQCIPMSHWSIRTLERGSVFLPSLPIWRRKEGRVITIRCLEKRSRAGSVYMCVCVCVCTPTHWCTVKPLHRKRLICMYNIKYEVSSSESYHNYITHFWL